MFDTASSLQLPVIPWERVKKLLPYLGIFLGVLGCILCLASIFLTPVVPAVQADSGDICVNQPHQGVVTIYVSGAVQNPGVYTFSTGERVAAALTAAGGVSSTADSVYIQKELNLAQELQDSQHVYIPFATERSTRTTSALQNSTNASGDHISSGRDGTDSTALGQLTSINTASQAELEALPRVGEKTAEKIIAGRPYTDLFQLVGTKVLSQSVYDEIKTQLTL